VKQDTASLSTNKPYYIAQVLCLVFLIHNNVWSQTKSNPTDTKIKEFLSPEAGLNAEIKAALSKIEQACQYTKPPKEFHQNSSSDLISRVESAKQALYEQRAIVNQALERFRIEHKIADNSCETLPNFLRLSAECRQFQLDKQKYELVSQAALSYFGESLDRYSSYVSAYRLESRGCTRSGFSAKLWAAEQQYIVPKLKDSGSTLAKMLE